MIVNTQLVNTAAKKEHMRTVSGNMDGIFCFEFFGMLGTKMWLKLVTKIRNVMVEVKAMAAIQDELSVPSITQCLQVLLKCMFCI